MGIPQQFQHIYRAVGLDANLDCLMISTHTPGGELGRESGAIKTMHVTALQNLVLAGANVYIWMIEPVGRKTHRAPEVKKPGGSGREFLRKPNLTGMTKSRVRQNITISGHGLGRLFRLTTRNRCQKSCFFYFRPKNTARPLEPAILETARIHDFTLLRRGMCVNLVRTSPTSILEKPAQKKLVKITFEIGKDNF